MDNEQLKMILDAMATMGAAGKDAFVWWLVLDKALPVIGWICTLAMIYSVARLITRSVMNNVQLEELRNALNLSPYSGKDKYFGETLKRALSVVRSQDTKGST